VADCVALQRLFQYMELRIAERSVYRRQPLGERCLLGHDSGGLCGNPSVIAATVRGLSAVRPRSTGVPAV